MIEFLVDGAINAAILFGASIGLLGVVFALCWVAITVRRRLGEDVSVILILIGTFYILGLIIAGSRHGG